jgi:hypothetical protein
MDNVFDWLKERLTERSTWAGIVAVVLGIVGIEATAVQTEQIVGSLTALIGVVLALISERKGG